MALLAGRDASLLENPKFRKVHPRLCAVSRRHDRTVVQSHSLDRRKRAERQARTCASAGSPTGQIGLASPDDACLLTNQFDSGSKAASGRSCLL